MSNEKNEHSREPATRGIPPAQTGNLAILQHTPPGFESGEPALGQVIEAAEALSRLVHRPIGPQAFNYEMLEGALAQFLEKIVRYAPPGAERSTAISRAREAGAWAAFALASEGR